MFFGFWHGVYFTVFRVFTVFRDFPGFDCGPNSSDFESAANTDKTVKTVKTVRNQDAHQSEVSKLSLINTDLMTPRGNTFWRLFPIETPRPMTRGALLVLTGPKVSVISKSGRSPVRHVTPVRIVTVRSPKCHFFMNFHVFHENHSFAKRRVITAGFEHGKTRENTDYW